MLIVLHGYWRTPEQVDELFHAVDLATARGLYVLLPTGSEDRLERLFWNASSACCDYFETGVDDVGYLEGLLEEVEAERPVDPDRVFVLGHSNGGFMAYRLACELAGRIAAVAVLAGADAPPDGGCAPTMPVSLLHLHGDADRRVRYVGATQIEPHPGAVETVAIWAERNGCTGGTVELEPIDLVEDIDGRETAVTAYRGCPTGVDTWLGTIEGGVHEPILSADGVGLHVIDWLLAHGR